MSEPKSKTGPGSAETPSLKEPGLLQTGLDFVPGLALCVIVALAASFLEQRYGGPEVLYALLLGMALNSLASVPQLGMGLVLCSRTVLRVGVALLGVRISLAVLSDLGVSAAVIVVIAVSGTLLTGFLLSRLLRRPLHEGLISGGAVGICGVSAALAVSSVFPASKEVERFTIVVAAGVTLLSTVAMLLYPLIAYSLGMTPTATAVFLGGSIHDVAQAVTAGLLVSQDTADSATVVKLFRVALLVPMILVIVMAVGRASRVSGLRPRGVPPLPGFLIAFCILATFSSAGMIPPAIAIAAVEISKWLLLTAIAAIGLRTSPRELLHLGWIPALMLLLETCVIAVTILIGLTLTSNQ